MMDENPIKTVRRLARCEAQNRCVFCGRGIRIEQHHVAGRNHDPPLTAPLCQACHALAAENACPRQPFASNLFGSKTRCFLTLMTALVRTGGCILNPSVAKTLARPRVIRVISLSTEGDALTTELLVNVFVKLG